jgi:hypothetical protein
MAERTAGDVASTSRSAAASASASPAGTSIRSHPGSPVRDAGHEGRDHGPSQSESLINTPEALPRSWAARAHGTPRSRRGSRRPKPSVMRTRSPRLRCRMRTSRSGRISPSPARNDLEKGALVRSSAGHIDEEHLRLLLAKPSTHTRRGVSGTGVMGASASARRCRTAQRGRVTSPGAAATAAVAAA